MKLLLITEIILMLTNIKKELYHQSLDGANGGRKKTRNKDKCPRLMEKQEISYYEKRKVI